MKLQEQLNQLLDLIEKGMTALEIRKAMKLTKASFERLCFQLFQVEKRFIEIPGWDESSIPNRKLTKSGLQIPAAMLEETFPLDSEFRMEKHDDKIVLTLVTEPESDPEEQEGGGD